MLNGSTVTRVVSFCGDIETLEDFVARHLAGYSFRLDCLLDPAIGPLNRLLVTIPEAKLDRLEGLVDQPIRDEDGGFCVIRYCV